MSKRIAAAVVIGIVLLGGAIGASFLDGDSEVDPLRPIAMAWINENGEPQCGTPNVSGTWDEENRRFAIQIEGEDYYFAKYVTIVTGTSGVSPSVVSDNGKLVIQLFNTHGQPARASFQFVTYKCSGS